MDIDKEFLEAEIEADELQYLNIEKILYNFLDIYASICILIALK